MCCINHSFTMKGSLYAYGHYIHMRIYSAFERLFQHKEMTLFG